MTAALIGAGAGTAPARIGPNAVIQTFAAIRDLAGAEAAEAVARAAGCPRWLADPPDAMVDERAVVRLFRALEATLPGDADAIEAEAGRRTADYILANRIPPAVRLLLGALPAGPSARLLTGAIARHAWTFAGSGRFTAEARGRPLRLTIAANPLAAGRRADRPCCAWHAAVFARLFRALVHPAASATETECRAAGAPACVFALRWDGG